MEKGGIFDSNVRKDIYDFIFKNPGLHMNALSRKMSIPKSTINYHLKCLKDEEYISEATDGRYIRYYIKNGIGEKDKKIINIIRQHIPYRIILLLFLNHTVTQKQLSKYLDRHPTTISFHLNKLIEQNIVEWINSGNEIQYCLKNPDHVSDLVLKYSGLIKIIL